MVHRTGRVALEYLSVLLCARMLSMTHVGGRDYQSDAALEYAEGQALLVPGAMPSTEAVCRTSPHFTHRSHNVSPRTVPDLELPGAFYDPDYLAGITTRKATSHTRARAIRYTLPFELSSH